MRIIQYFIIISLLILYSASIYSQTPDWSWAKSVGGAEVDRSFSIDVDSSGNSFIVGSFESDTIYFGSTMLIHSGNGDFFIAKYDYYGNPLWAKSSIGNGGDAAMSVSIDPSGNAICTGNYTSSTITFDSIILQNNNFGDPDIFLSKYDSNGNILWAKSAGGPQNDQANCVIVDSSGNSFVVGFFHSQIIAFDTIIANNNSINGFSDIFLAKYDNNGNIISVKSTGGIYNDYATTVSNNSLGGICLSGWYDSPSIHFDSIILTNAGVYDIFLANYNSNGDLLWVRSAGGTDLDWPSSMVSDISGNIYLAGWFKSQTITFDTITLFNTSPYGFYDIFLVKYNSSGNVVWAKSFGGDQDDQAFSIATDSIGNLYMVGSFKSPIISFGSNTLLNTNSLGSSDIFITKFDDNGILTWAKSVLGNGHDWAYSTSISSNGSVFITGHFSSTPLTFGNINLSNVNGYDIYIAKLDSNYETLANECFNQLKTSVYPNPVNDKLTIEIDEKAILEIINMQGQIIETKSLTEKVNNLDLSNLKSGVYTLRITTDRGIAIRKLIKQ